MAASRLVGLIGRRRRVRLKILPGAHTAAYTYIFQPHAHTHTRIKVIPCVIVADEPQVQCRISISGTPCRGQPSPASRALYPPNEGDGPMHPPGSHALKAPAPPAVAAVAAEIAAAVASVEGGCGSVGAGLAAASAVLAAFPPSTVIGTLGPPSIPAGSVGLKRKRRFVQQKVCRKCCCFHHRKYATTSLRLTFCPPPPPPHSHTVDAPTRSIARTSARFADARTPASAR
jgi:hypothetical protein